MKRIFFVVLLVALMVCNGLAADTKVVKKLPAPDTKGGKPLMQVLSERQSVRMFLTDPVDDQMLSNLLWAGFGENRPGGRRTAPTSNNAQDIEIYVAKADGTWLYDAQANSLIRVTPIDGRLILAGRQSFAAAAPLGLIFVADKAKAQGDGYNEFYPYMHVGSIYQNIGLYCASAGLGDVVRSSFDYQDMSKALNLPASKYVIISQTVGFVKENADDKDGN